MSEPILLTCSARDYEALVIATQTARKGSTTVRVSVKALEALIVDHGRLLRVTPHKEPSE